MKLKAYNGDEEQTGIKKEVYELFVDLIQHVINQATYAESAKVYCELVGYPKYSRFFSSRKGEYVDIKRDLINFLANRLEKIPEFKIPAWNISTENIQDVFDKMTEMEERYCGLLENVFTAAREFKEIQVECFIGARINEFEHECCKAAEAVRNKQDIDIPIKLHW